MKKTLVALAVAAVAATSANAAVVYNQDGTKVDIGGQLRLALSQDKGERTDLKYGSSRLITSVTQDLGDGFSALANVQFRFDDEDDHNAYAHNLFAGFAKDNIGTLTFGRQETNSDDLGISDYTYDLGDVKLTHNHDNKAVKFRSAEWGGFSFGLDYFFGGAKKYSADEQNGKGWGGALFYTAQIANDTTLTLNGGFTQVRKNETTIVDVDTDLDPIGYLANGSKVYGPEAIAKSDVKEHKENAFVVGAELATGPFALAVDYTQKKLTNNVDKELTDNGFSVGTGFEDDFNKLRALEVGAKYNYLENAKVYGEYQYYKATKAAGSDKLTMNGFILGTDYWVAKNVVTYLEAGTFKYERNYNDDKDTRDNKVRLGMRFYF